MGPAEGLLGPELPESGSGDEASGEAAGLMGGGDGIGDAGGAGERGANSGGAGTGADGGAQAPSSSSEGSLGRLSLSLAYSASESESGSESEAAWWGSTPGSSTLALTAARRKRASKLRMRWTWALRS